VLANQARSQRRRDRLLSHLTDQAARSSSTASLPESHDHGAVARALRSLSDRDRFARALARAQADQSEHDEVPLPLAIPSPEG
jgi:hypothetical protein